MRDEPVALTAVRAATVALAGSHEQLLLACCVMACMAGAELTGQLLVNGELRDEKAFKRVSAYVTQVRTDGRLPLTHCPSQGRRSQPLMREARSCHRSGRRELASPSCPRLAHSWLTCSLLLLLLLLPDWLDWDVRVRLAVTPCPL